MQRTCHPADRAQPRSQPPLDERLQALHDRHRPDGDAPFAISMTCPQLAMMAATLGDADPTD